MGVQYWRWTHLWQESQQPHFVNTSETALRSSDGVKLLQTQHFSLSSTDSSLLEQSSITLTWLTFEILETPDVPCVGLLGLDFFLDWDLTDLTFGDLDSVARGDFFLLTGWVTGFFFDDWDSMCDLIWSVMFSSVIALPLTTLLRVFLILATFTFLSNSPPLFSRNDLATWS